MQTGQLKLGFDVIVRYISFYKYHIQCDCIFRNELTNAAEGEGKFAYEPIQELYKIINSKLFIVVYSNIHNILLLVIFSC